MKRCFSLHLLMTLGSLCCLKNLHLWGCSASGAPFITAVSCTHLPSMFFSNISVVTWHCPSCFCVSSWSHPVPLLCTGAFCIVRFLILPLLAPAATAVPALTAGAAPGGLCLVIPSQTFPRNYCFLEITLITAGCLCICVCGVNSRGCFPPDAVIMKLWYQIH